MILHIVGLPHAHLTSEFATCAYTQKIVKFKRMFPDAIVYGGEGSDVETFTERERADWFGPHDLQAMHPPVWEASGAWWQITNLRAANAIQERKQPGDLLLLSGGVCQKPIADMLTDMTACEPFVGYEGITTPYRAFESHAWRHHVYGLRQERFGNHWDTVIPNYFDPDEFRVKPRKGDYLLFLGRVTQKKGPHVAAEIADNLGLELVVAGPGVQRVRGRIIYGEGVHFPGRYVGAVGIEERAELLAGARCLLAPTLYIEPFGGVAVEAMMAGTPVVATDFGAFPETVENGVTGQRFTTLAEGIAAVERCDVLDPRAIHKRAFERYSLKAVEPMFRAWFDRLATLKGEGWYA